MDGSRPLDLPDDLIAFAQCPICGGNCYVYDTDENGNPLQDICHECKGMGSVVIAHETRGSER